MKTSNKSIVSPFALSARRSVSVGGCIEGYNLTSSFDTSTFVTLRRTLRTNGSKLKLLFMGIFLASFCCTAANNASITSLKKTLLNEPLNVEARLQLAKIYQDAGDYDQAITTLTNGIMLEPNQVNLLFTLGNLYNLTNQFDKSLTIYRNLNERAPNVPSILYNIGYTLKKMERPEEALPFYNKVVELTHPGDSLYTAARFGRSLNYLIMGDLERGFADYEYRFRPAYHPLFQFVLNEPVWDGSDLHGKTILIHNAEQSFGDTFHFIRYAKLVKEKNGYVIAAVQPALVPIIQLCPYIDEVVSKDETPPHFDVQARIMSLPYILKTRLDTVPNECPYLYADEKLTEYWQQKLAYDTNFKIGICWQASAADRSIPLELLAPLFTIPGTSIYNLQKTTDTDQFNDFPEINKLITFDGDFDQSNGSFMDTAAVIKQLDLVITVDTSICHLAGALGINTWILRPNPADWRWIVNRTDTPWYASVRLFKQHTPGKWESMIQEVAQELEKYITQK